jgi:hypothetical protein
VAFMNFCVEGGIVRQFTNFYTLEQNSVSKQKIVLLLSELDQCYKLLTFLILFRRMLSQQPTTSQTILSHLHLEGIPL